MLDKQTESNYALMSNTQGEAGGRGVGGNGGTAIIKMYVSYESDDGGVGPGWLAEGAGPNEPVCNVLSCAVCVFVAYLKLHSTRDTARRG